jgi:glycosyltransferase involved in cell wall biosynthesis
MTRSLLIVGHELPYPIEVGVDAARFGLLSALSRSFRVTVLAVGDDERTRQNADALRKVCEDVVLVPPSRQMTRRRGIAGSLLRNANLLLRRMPRTLQMEHHESVGPAVERLTADGRFDFAHFAYWTTAKYRPYARCPAALLNVDAWFQTIEGYAHYARSPVARLSWTLESRTIRRREVEAQRLFDWSLFLTEEDREAIERAAGRLRRSVVVPIPYPFVPAEESTLEGVREPIALFTGALGAPFNIDAIDWFAREVWPFVHAQLPEARLVITGREPHTRVQRLDELPGVEVAGWVPDLSDLLRRASLVVAPMRIGTGIKVKVPHAMAAGLPVVGTSRALRGLPQSEGVVSADEPGELAARAVELMSDGERRTRLARAALETYREKLWIESVWRDVVALYERIIAEARGET